MDCRAEYDFLEPERSWVTGQIPADIHRNVYEVTQYQDPNSVAGMVVLSDDLKVSALVNLVIIPDDCNDPITWDYYFDIFTEKDKPILEYKEERTRRITISKELGLLYYNVLHSMTKNVKYRYPQHYILGSPSFHFYSSRAAYGDFFGYSLSSPADSPVGRLISMHTKILHLYAIEDEFLDLELEEVRKKSMNLWGDLNAELIDAVSIFKLK